MDIPWQCLKRGFIRTSLLGLFCLNVSSPALADGYDAYYQMMMNGSASAPNDLAADEEEDISLDYYLEDKTTAEAFVDGYPDYYQQTDTSVTNFPSDEPTTTSSSYAPAGSSQTNTGYSYAYYQQMMSSQGCAVPADSGPETTGTGTWEDPQITTSILDGVKRREEFRAAQTLAGGFQASSEVGGYSVRVFPESLTELKTVHQKYNTANCTWEDGPVSSVEESTLRYEQANIEGYSGWAKTVKYHYGADSEKGWEENYSYSTGQIKGNIIRAGQIVGRHTVEWSLRTVGGIKYGTVTEVSEDGNGRRVMTLRRYQRSADGRQEITTSSSRDIYDL